MTASLAACVKMIRLARPEVFLALQHDTVSVIRFLSLTRCASPSASPIDLSAANQSLYELIPCIFRAHFPSP